MKKIIIFLLFSFVLMNVMAQSALCSSNDYNTFLMSRTDTPPADMINENA
ncbi:MAG: hypothetical protein ACPLYF_00755 [Fervidobacterium sp.]